MFGKPLHRSSNCLCIKQHNAFYISYDPTLQILNFVLASNYILKAPTVCYAQYNYIYNMYMYIIYIYIYIYQCIHIYRYIDIDIDIDI